MNKTRIDLLLAFDFVLNKAPMIGILESNGVPELFNDFEIFSNPPNTIISSFFTRIIDLNCVVDELGGPVALLLGRKDD